MPRPHDLAFARRQDLLTAATPLLASLAGAAVLAAVHVATPALRFLGGTPRSAWLSIAGGVAVAYVFVHLLPELAAGQEHISRAIRAGHGSVTGERFAERHVYLIALAGLAAFYGLDKLAKRSRGQWLEGERASDDGDAGASTSGREQGIEPGAATSPAVFWVHMASFGIYNALVGYLLMHREQPGLSSLAFFTVAMALHFLVSDFGLLEDHKAPYRRIGRWMLVAAVFAGVGVGAARDMAPAPLAVLVAFLAGGVMLNVLKEEVPSERRSRFWAFLLGMGEYAALLLFAA